MRRHADMATELDAWRARVLSPASQQAVFDVYLGIPYPLPTPQEFFVHLLAAFGLPPLDNVGQRDVYAGGDLLRALAQAVENMQPGSEFDHVIKRCLQLYIHVILQFGSNNVDDSLTELLQRLRQDGVEAYTSFDNDSVMVILALLGKAASA